MQLQVVQHIDLPMWSVYTVQYAVFGTGLFGITYGILSARQVRTAFSHSSLQILPEAAAA